MKKIQAAPGSHIAKRRRVGNVQLVRFRDDEPDFTIEDASQYSGVTGKVVLRDKKIDSLFARSDDGSSIVLHVASDRVERVTVGATDRDFIELIRVYEQARESLLGACLRRIKKDMP